MQHATSDIAFVVPRYGPSVVGGAETLCRMLAEDLASHGTPIDVLTTCAADHFTWANALPAGDERINGVRVRRFTVGARDTDRFGGLHAAIDLGATLPYREQIEWLGNSVWAPGILEASAQYQWLIAMPYLFGTTFWTAVAYPDSCVMVPCLHDEAHARQPAMLDALASVKGVMLNAAGEGMLLDRLLGQHRGGVATRTPPRLVGGGFDEQPIPDAARVEAFLARHGADRGYLLYAGRRERAKGVVDLYDAYRAYRQSVPDPRPLALMGSGDSQPPGDIARHVIDFGFVPLEDRALAYAGAEVLLHPSRLESFGLVLFEAWMAGTPAIVNAQSDVLRQHCAVSGGGLWFADTATFVECVAAVTDDTAVRRSLADAGRQYTLTEFRWSAVRGRFLDALEAWE